MIFVTVGSQKFQFNRLLREVDRLIEVGVIKEEVFGQIGHSDYIPKNYKYQRSLSRDEFGIVMNKSKLLITHGGTGAIISGLKHGKKVIAIPRLQSFNEHVDDHQIEITSIFYKKCYIEYSTDISDLEFLIAKSSMKEYETYVSNTETIVKEIEKIIDNI